jgi:DNA-binding NarL/FixJ family response regulator
VDFHQTKEGDMTDIKSPDYRILLIDDHPAIRTGLNILLKSRNIEVNAEADSKKEALTLLQDKQFDLALLDLTLKDGSGLELLPELRNHGIPALVYTMHEDSEIINQAFQYGALGYVSKQEDAEILFEAIDSIATGKQFVSPCALASLEMNESIQHDPENRLSSRESEIFMLIGKGYGNTEIAEKLGLSRRTVETYCSRIVQKMNLESRKELRKLAISVS